MSFKINIIWLKQTSKKQQQKTSTQKFTNVLLRHSVGTNLTVEVTEDVLDNFGKNVFFFFLFVVNFVIH